MPGRNDSEEGLSSMEQGFKGTLNQFEDYRRHNKNNGNRRDGAAL